MKPHTIAETLILPAAIDMVKTMCVEAEGQTHTNTFVRKHKECMLLLAIKRKRTERLKLPRLYSPNGR